MFQLSGLSTVVKPSDLMPAMKELWEKCLSRYGSRLPGCDYEVLVSFAA